MANPIQSSRNKAIYSEEDERKNLYSLKTTIPNEEHARIMKSAQSVACMIRINYTETDDGGIKLEKISILKETKFSVRQLISNMTCMEPLGEKVHFANEPSLGFGTAFYIGHQLALTAAHCVCKKDTNCLDETNIRVTRLIFGFEMSDEQTYPNTFKKKDVYRIKEVIDHRYLRAEYNKDDWALIKLDREVEDRSPLELDFIHKVVDKIKLYMLGHPVGLPLKFTSNGIVQGDLENKNYFEARLDAFRGNSGSPVFDQTTHKVVGILFDGNDDYEWVQETGEKKVTEYRHKEGDGYEACQRITSLYRVQVYIKSLNEQKFDEIEIALWIQNQKEKISSAEKNIVGLREEVRELEEGYTKKCLWKYPPDGIESTPEEKGTEKQAKDSDRRIVRYVLLDKKYEPSPELREKIEGSNFYTLGFAAGGTVGFTAAAATTATFALPAIATAGMGSIVSGVLGGVVSFVAGAMGAAGGGFGGVVSTSFMLGSPTFFHAEGKGYKLTEITKRVRYRKGKYVYQITLDGKESRVELFENQPNHEKNSDLIYQKRTKIKKEEMWIEEANKLIEEAKNRIKGKKEWEEKVKKLTEGES